MAHTFYTSSTQNLFQSREKLRYAISVCVCVCVSNTLFDAVVPCFFVVTDLRTCAV